MKTMGKVGVMVFNDTYVMRSVFIGGGNRGKPLTCRKSFIK
jgi:hypothetical protein